MADQKNGNKSGTYKDNFTVDTQSGLVREMPSISRLLNRRTFPGRQPPPRPSKKKKSGTRSLFVEQNDGKVENAGPAPTTASPSAPPSFEPNYVAPYLALPSTTTAAPAPPPAPPAAPARSELTPIVLESAMAVATRAIAAPGLEFSAAPPPPAAPPVPPPSAGHTTLTQAAAAPPPPMAPLRERKTPTAGLLDWTPERLSRTQDPLGQAILAALNIGLKSAVFFAIRPPAPGAQVPAFVATATVHPGTRSSLWNGLRWNPMVVPEVWNEFTQKGFVEIASPDLLPPAQANRNVLRVAFGIQASEWFTFVRVGPGNACRGAIALISDATLFPALSTVLERFHSLPQSKKKPAASGSGNAA